jgi:uncharacterized protein involved in exopolysaccharide biosynthesis
MDNDQKNQMKQNNIDNYEITLKDLVLTLKEWLFFIYGKRIKVFLAILFGIIIGYTYSHIQKPEYKATMTFALEDDKGNSGGMGGAASIASSLGIDIGSSGGGAFSANNIMALMQSRLVVEKTLLNTVLINNNKITLANFFIDSDSDFKNKILKNKSLKSITYEPGADRSKYTITHDSLLYVIYKKIISENLNIILKDKKVSILTLTVLSENELFAKLFCENLAKEVSNFYIQTKSQKARYNVDLLQKQVDSVRQELASAILGVASETDNIYNLNPSLNKKGSIIRRRQVDVQSNTTILSQLVAQLEIGKVNLRKETPLIQVIDKPILPLDNTNHGQIYWIVLLSTFFVLIYLFIISLNKFYKSVMKD